MTQLAVALDTRDVSQAQDWAAQVREHIDVLKLGLEFYLRNGAAGVVAVRRAAPDCGLFLDLKLHDIPATVAGASRSVSSLSPDYLTVHAAGGAAMVAAAAQELPNTAITAVTVLTSLGESDLDALGVTGSPESVATRWAQLAVAAGARALVCSVWEAAAIRRAVGAEPGIVTPGIRAAGSATQDQTRVATPQVAASKGATLLVVGRPITQAADPAKAAADFEAVICRGRSRDI